ncbi:hypothetical protein JHD50_01790, partial [Sulfurimonas sp. MAG313]
MHINLKTLTQEARNNIKGLLELVFTHTSKEKAVLVYDENSTLSRVLSQAYMAAMPHAKLINFDKETPENILASFELLSPFDLVILVQSTSFRLDAFRMRIELFKKKIKVLEHPHLSRMTDEQVPIYINSLNYDKDYFTGVGRTLKTKVDSASQGVIDSGGETLIYDTPFEPAKLNIGDYSEMVNTGGQFPIGEVFTEAQDLTALNGRLNIYCFGDVTYKINTPE